VGFALDLENKCHRAQSLFPRDADSMLRSGHRDNLGVTILAMRLGNRWGAVSIPRAQMRRRSPVLNCFALERWKRDGLR
jgi:hypothetical protein